MQGECAVIVEGKQRAMAELQRLVNELLRRLWLVGRAVPSAPLRFHPGRRRGEDTAPHPAPFRFEYADYDLHVVFAKAVEAKFVAGGIDFPVGADLGVAVLGGPLGNVRVKTL